MHLAAALGEHHSKIVEVPEDGAEGAKPSDDQDHVIAVQRDGEAVHRERVLTDPDGNVMGQAAVGHVVAVGVHDVRSTTVAEL